MIRRLAIGLVVTVLLGVGASRVDALVLCARKDRSGNPRNGAALHLGTACKSKQVQVDPDALGLRGPQGAPGLVRAYGRINAAGELDADFPSAGIVSARTASAYHCIKLDPSIDALRAVATIALDGNEVLGPMVNGGNSTIYYGIALHGLSLCDQGNELAVATGGLYFTAGSLAFTGFGPGTSFYIQIP